MCSFRPTLSKGHCSTSAGKAIEHLKSCGGWVGNTVRLDVFCRTLIEGKIGQQADLVSFPENSLSTDLFCKDGNKRFFFCTKVFVD